MRLMERTGTSTKSNCRDYQEYTLTAYLQRGSCARTIIIAVSKHTIRTWFVRLQRKSMSSSTESYEKSSTKLECPQQHLTILHCLTTEPHL